MSGGPYSIGAGMPVYSEEDCEGALFMAKWPSGYRCPRCVHPQYYNVASKGRKLFECISCGHQTSLTAGTVLEGTRTPLCKWFQAMYLMQIGISAKLLSELIQVTYKTAWLMNHKLRYAIEQWDRELPLQGQLQLLGEFYGYEFSRHFSSISADAEQRAQPVIVGASIVESTGTMTNLKIKRMECAGSVPEDSGELERFLRNHAVHAVDRAGEVKVFDRRDRRERSALHAIWTDAVRWLARTFGGIGPKHLQAYLDEFCFRRVLRNESMAELIGLCGRTNTIINRDLVGKRAGIQPIRRGRKYTNSRRKVAS